VEQIMDIDDGTRVQILAHLIDGKKGEHAQLIRRLRRDGFTRVKVDGKIRVLDEDILLAKNKKHTISVVVDRLVINKSMKRRLTDSMELTLNMAEGQALLDVVGSGETLFSQKAACTKCGISIPELTPQMFSFNNPHGAGEDCGGLATKRYFDPEMIIPDPDLSLREGAIAPWANRHSVYFQQMLDSLCRHFKIDTYTPFKDLPKKVQKIFLHGSE